VACLPALRILIRRADVRQIMPSADASSAHTQTRQSLAYLAALQSKRAQLKSSETDNSIGLVDPLSGQYILKAIDFEITSERASQISAPNRPPQKRVEQWELP